MRKLSDDDREEIVRLYTTPLVDGTWIGTPAIAKQFGVTPTAIRARLIAAGVQPRASREALRGRRTKPITHVPVGAAPMCKCGCGSPTAWNRSKNRWNVYAEGHYRRPVAYSNAEWLREHYVDKNMTTDEIAAMFGVRGSSIVKAMKKHGIERRTKSAARVGRKGGARNPAWKGGVTPERQRFYRTQEWKALLASCFARDGYHCVRCGCIKTSTDPLHAHHVRSWADYPELRKDIANLITLCEQCHLWVHSAANAALEYVATG